MRETDVRTPKLDLQMCKMILTDDNRLLFEFKKGKRCECLSWESLNQKINEFTEGKIPIITI